ncbi:unnamed protein product [Lota lota]
MERRYEARKEDGISAGDGESASPDAAAPANRRARQSLARAPAEVAFAPRRDDSRPLSSHADPCPRRTVR